MMDGLRAKIENEYRLRTPKSRALSAEARKLLPGGETRTITHFDPYPLFITEGSGCRIKDADGNEYLDLLNNYTSLIHGHAHREVVESLVLQIKEGVCYAAPTENQSRLARMLCARVESVELIRFCNSGTEATMLAIRAAKGFTQRNKILKMEGGYHGSHDAAQVSVAPTVRAGPERSPHSVASSTGLFRGIVDDVVVAPFNNIEATRDILEHNASELAAVIVEPVLGSAGMIPADGEYLTALREVTRSKGILLIFDEVITFRLAYGGAQQLYRVTPDLTTFGKFIGGGLPVGAFGGRADIMAQFDPTIGNMSHSGTFNGNELTMTAGITTLSLLPRHELERLNSLGEELRKGIGQVCRSLRVPAQVTGAGSLLQLHFLDHPIRDYRTAAVSDKSLLHLLHLSLLNRGIFIAPRGLMCVSTPMSLTQIDDVVRAFHDAFGTLRPVT
jgi:glutamate-1-semialdehyde 2,1-aminomutase